MARFGINRLEITGGNWGEVLRAPGVTRICRGVNELGDYAYLNGGGDPLDDGFAYAGDALEWADGDRRATVARGEANVTAWKKLRAAEKLRRQEQDNRRQGDE